MIYSQDLDRVSVPQCLCLCHKRSVFLSLLHANLLQSSDIAATLLKSIWQSMDEESIKNIILAHCKRGGLFPLPERSVCFMLIVALIPAFLPKLFFWANCIQFSKISADPIIRQAIPHLKAQLWQHPYFIEFRYPEAVNSLLMWFFR